MVTLLQDRLSKQGILVSLDCLQCFDRLHPEVTRRYLCELGRDNQFVTLFCHMWTTQQRWICCQDTVLAAERCAPRCQGDPISPLILTLWVAAGEREVAHACPVVGISTSVASTYMDDRSWVSPSWPHASRCMQAWACWSKAVGFKKMSKRPRTTSGARL